MERRWQARQEEQDALVRQARDRKTQLGADKDARHAEACELSAEHARVRAENQSATASLKRTLSWRDQLQRRPALGEVQGVDVADLEQPRLEHALRKHADDARRRILELSVDAAEGLRSLEVLRDEGFLPPSRDVEKVLRSLHAQKISAHAGLRYLAENHSSGESHALLTADPARYAGVIVMRQEDVAAAGALAVDELRLRNPVQVTWTRERHEPADPVGCVVVAPDPALYDRPAADLRRHELTDASERLDRDVKRLRRREEEFSAAADELARYLGEWGGGKLDHHEGLLRAQVQREASLCERIDALKRRIDEIEHEIQAAQHAAELAGQEGKRAEFGDLDDEGLQIPASAWPVLRASELPLVAAERWYELLLQRADSLEAEAPPVDGRALAWISPGLRPRVAALLGAGRRLPQEYVGWELLRTLTA